MSPALIRVLPAATEAEFIDRPNRFVVRARLAGRVVRAALPNPGRLGELLLPGAGIFLVPAATGSERKTKHTAVAVRRDASIRLLDTHRSNDLAEALLRAGAIPSLRHARIVRREVPHGRSRFDFLLEDDDGPIVLEVKSCNLIERGLCLFPDAPTDRGRRHVLELAEIAARGGRAAVLFLVHDPKARAFLPHVHTDLAFARTLFETAERFPGSAEACHDRFRMIAAAVGLREDLAAPAKAREIPIPIGALRNELEDRGAYLVLLRLARGTRIDVGALGAIVFPAGWYAYAGSAERGLAARIERHRRLRKRTHWHVDYLRQAATFVEAFPFRSSRRDECAVAAATARLADAAVDRFGSSDCTCPSHLFHFRTDPRATRAFQDLLAEFRHRLSGT